MTVVVECSAVVTAERRVISLTARPGSDWSVVPSVNPWSAVETLVTREEPGGSARSSTSAVAAYSRFMPEAMREKFGGDSLTEMKRNYDGYRAQISRY